MRIGHLQPTRPEWYDRRPSTFIKTFQQDSVNAGFGGTTRWTYTVPAGKKCYIDSAQAYIHLRTIRTDGTYIGVVISYTPAVGTSDFINLRVYENVPGAGGRAALAAIGIMSAGDVVSGGDYGTTAGTYDVETSVKLTEFDA